MGIVVHRTSPDGLWGVIEAQDQPQDCPRSKTRDTEDEALNATWDPALTTPVGPGSKHKFIKVRLADLGGPRPRVVLSPGNFTTQGKGKRFIPEYPHTCPTCGGKMLQLFTSQEHEGGGECPGRAKRARRV